MPRAVILMEYIKMKFDIILVDGISRSTVGILSITEHHFFRLLKQIICLCFLFLTQTYSDVISNH